MVAEANHRVGVNGLLLQIGEQQALHSALEASNARYAAADVECDVLEEYFAEQVKALEAHGTPIRPITVFLRDEKDAKRTLKEIDLKISNLRDELAVLNLTTKIDISQVEQVLKDEMLI